MSTIFVKDRLTYSLGKSKRKYTDEGFLSVPGKAARTGIQKYLAAELGLKDRNPIEVVSVYRPPEEVFSDQSLESYKYKDVTNDHPGELVSADSYRDVSVGVITDSGRRDGDFVVADMIIKDGSAIKEVEGGKVELSAGYTAEYVYQPGVTEDGQEYEFIQRNIVINHVALVDKARAGNEATLFDNQPKGANPMPINVTLDSGVSVEVADQNAATYIRNALDSRDSVITKLEKEVVSKDNEHGKTRAQLDAANEKLAALEAKTSDEAIAQLVNERVNLVSAAAKVVGDKYTADGKTNDQIMLDICKAAFPKRSFDGQPEGYIKACYDQAMEKVEEEEKAKEKEKKETGDSLNGLAGDFSNIPAGEPQAVRDASYQAYLDKLNGVTQQEGK